MTSNKNGMQDEVIERERSEEIKPGREAARKSVNQDDAGNASENESRNLVGLAFSGGGQEATFNLGVILALTERRWLHKFDYLSTVSDGAYTAGMLDYLIEASDTWQGIIFVNSASKEFIG